MTKPSHDEDVKEIDDVVDEDDKDPFEGFRVDDIDDNDTSDDDTDEEEESKPKGKHAKEEEDSEETIIYNGKEIKLSELPKDERKTYLQKGMNYDKIYSKYNDMSSKLQRLSEVSGKDLDSLISVIENESIRQEAVKLADDRNIDEDDAVELVKERRKNEADRKQLEATKRESDVKAEKTELKDKRHFSDLEEDIDRMLQLNPKLTVKGAYTYLLGERFEELAQKESSLTQKRTIANVQDKMKRTVDARSSSGDDVKVSKSLKTFADAFGVDPKKAAQRNKSRDR